MEKLLEELAFSADQQAGAQISIDADYVDTKLKALATSEDLARYVL